MKKVKNIGNFYGGLIIKEFNGKFYWIIENHDTDFSNILEWDEISETLYKQLLLEVDSK